MSTAPSSLQIDGAKSWVLKVSKVNLGKAALSLSNPTGPAILAACSSTKIVSLPPLRGPNELYLPRKSLPMFRSGCQQTAPTLPASAAMRLRSPPMHLRNGPFPDAQYGQSEQKLLHTLFGRYCDTQRLVHAASRGIHSRCGSVHPRRTNIRRSLYCSGTQPRREERSPSHHR